MSDTAGTSTTVVTILSETRSGGTGDPSATAKGW